MRRERGPWLTLLARVSHPDDREWIVADAVEEYRRRLEVAGPRAARRWLRRQALGAIRPGLSERWRRRGRPHSALAARRSGGARQLLGDAGRDALHAVRSLRRTPGLVLVVVGSLGVGVGGTTVVFSMARSLLFPDAGPMRAPEEVVTIYESSDDGTPWSPVAFPNYRDILEGVPALSEVAAARMGVVRLGEAADGERLMVEIVTGNYFDLLGVPAALGRTFAADETRLGSAEALYVMSHEFWVSRFEGSPDVLGRTLLLDGRPHTVIGVAPPGLVSRLLQLRVAGWIPLGIPGGTYNADDEELANRADREYLVMGRRGPGVTLARVETQLAGLGAQLAERHPQIWTDDRGEARAFSILPESESRLPPDFRPVGTALFGLLLAGTGLILAVACTNIAGLLLARAQRRAGEMAIRVSIGAGRGRLVRMLLTESAILAAAGGALGILLAVILVRRGAAIPLPGTLPDLAFRLGVDSPVLALSLAVTMGSALLFGLAPALQAARSEGALSSGVRGGSVASRGRRVLVSLQFAGSVVFLVAAGLLVRSVGNSVAADPGLRTDHLAVLSMRRDADVEAASWLDALEQELLLDDGISEVALATAVEVSPFWDMTTARIRLAGLEEPIVTPFNAVTPAYAELVELDLTRGRWLDGRDRAGGEPAVVVSERFVTAHFPGDDPIGRTFTIESQRALSTTLPAPPVTARIVGVAESVRNTPLDPPGPFFWASLHQFPAPLVMVHARGPSPAEAVAGLRRRGAGEVTLVGPSTYEELTDTNTLGQRAVARLLFGGALFALVMAVIGLGGLLSVSVAMRMPELSIRKALGATQADVVRSVLAESGRLAAWGIAAGLALAIPAALMARGLLPGVSPLDPPTLLATVALLCACAAVTALPAALRAGAADPLRHLRGD